MAYIDSELTKRRHMHPTSSNLSAKANGNSTASTIDVVVQRQPAALGKLQEVDLGPDAASLNAARTEVAKRRLEGGNAEPEEAPGKVRLGKDGKPRRARRRRNSDDVKRDKLVEEVLRESKREFSDDILLYGILTLLQLIYMTSRRRSSPTMIRQQTIGLQSSSGESLWMRYHSAGRRQPSQARNLVQVWLMTSRRGPN